MAIFEELLEAMNQAYMLGLKLNLPSHELDATYPDPPASDPCIPEAQLLNRFTGSLSEDDLDQSCS